MAESTCVDKKEVHGFSCDYWTQKGYSCSVLRYNNFKCRGCSCPAPFKTFAILDQGTQCKANTVVQSVDECQRASWQLGIDFKASVSTPQYPNGCVLSLQRSGTVFNTVSQPGGLNNIDVRQICHGANVQIEEMWFSCSWRMYTPQWTALVRKVWEGKQPNRTTARVCNKKITPTAPTRVDRGYVPGDPDAPPLSPLEQKTVLLLNPSSTDVGCKEVRFSSDVASSTGSVTLFYGLDITNQYKRQRRRRARRLHAAKIWKRRLRRKYHECDKNDFVIAWTGSKEPKYQGSAFNVGWDRHMITLAGGGVSEAQFVYANEEDGTAIIPLIYFDADTPPSKNNVGGRRGQLHISLNRGSEQIGTELTLYVHAKQGGAIPWNSKLSLDTGGISLESEVSLDAGGTFKALIPLVGCVYKKPLDTFEYSKIMEWNAAKPLRIEYTSDDALAGALASKKIIVQLEAKSVVNQAPVDVYRFGWNPNRDCHPSSSKNPG